jgi:hypothetical protein
MTLGLLLSPVAFSPQSFIMQAAQATKRCSCMLRTAFGDGRFHERSSTDVSQYKDERKKCTHPVSSDDCAEHFVTHVNTVNVWNGAASLHIPQLA